MTAKRPLSSSSAGGLSDPTSVSIDPNLTPLLKKAKADNASASGQVASLPSIFD